MADYLETIYNEDTRPLNSYPGKLAEYIVSNFKLKPNDKFLEPGFGRGEFLNEFSKLGLDCYGIDIIDGNERDISEIYAFLKRWFDRGISIGEALFGERIWNAVLVDGDGANVRLTISVSQALDDSDLTKT